MPDELQRRATTPDRMSRPTWSVEDVQVRDNRGQFDGRSQAGGAPLHRVVPAERTAPRRAHCTTGPESGL